MDGDPVTGEPSEEPKSFSEIFADVFPYYLAMGMSYDEFWRGSPSLVRDYRKAHEIKLQREEWSRHRQGMYFMQALRVAMSGFAKDKSNPETYPQEPWPLTEKEAREQEQREARNRYNRMREKLLGEARAARKKRDEEAVKKEAGEDGGD